MNTSPSYTPISIHPNVNTIGQLLLKRSERDAKTLFDNMIVASERDAALDKQVGSWLNGRGSTILLRKCAKRFGSYWGDLKFANSVDAIDSASASIA